MPYAPDDFRPVPGQVAGNRPIKAPSKPVDASEPEVDVELPDPSQSDLEADLPPYLESVQVTPKPRKRGSPKPKQTEERPNGIIRRVSIKSWKVDPAVIAKQMYS